jgi:hypothetical protein
MLRTGTSTGTSTNTLTTVASAAPAPGPNSAMTVATASSKKLLAPISAPGAATVSSGYLPPVVVPIMSCRWCCPVSAHPHADAQNRGELACDPAGSAASPAASG